MQTVIDSFYDDKPKRAPVTHLRLALAVLAVTIALMALSVLLSVALSPDSERAQRDEGACAAPIADAVADPLSQSREGGPVLDLHPDPTSLLHTTPQLGAMPCYVSPER
ncbi:MAG: hypothetical protein NZ750_13015 [Anaerolineae bacterium]|nr:hypothetical protein [Anaerolineae bacterium]MDW8173697.1 hypothetical protein [Anaerolineae bacterium]